MKKKKKKLLPLALCLIVLVAILASRNTKDSGDSNASKEIVATNTDEAADTADSAVTIDEQVLVDQDGIVITAKEYVADDILGDSIKLLIENNSDKDVTIGCSALIVNDYMITDLFAQDVAAGKSANESLDLLSSELEASGIDTIGQIEVYFHVYDTETYDTIFDADCATIKTSEYANMDTTPNDTGTELYNDGGIKIVGKTVDEDSFWGTAIVLYCENNSGTNVGISVDDMSINGFMIDPVFSTTVYDGKKSIDEITIFSSDLEKNNIESIEDVELQFHIYDADSYATIADSDKITFAAQ